MIELRLIGKGIAQSLTPALHMGEARAQGLALNYQLADSAEQAFNDLPIGDMLTKPERAGANGANITYPFKHSVLSPLDELSPEAALIGALNTVTFKNGRRAGFNTDIYGSRRMIEIGLEGKIPNEVLLIGAGGAGAAVIRALCEIGVKIIWLVDRDHARAAKYADRFSTNACTIYTLPMAGMREMASNVDGFINATPMGMAKMPTSPIPAELITPHHFVADIVYFPLETELLMAAKMRGATIIKGSLMAIYQAAKAFEIFTRQKPDEARMMASFD